MIGEFEKLYNAKDFDFFLTQLLEDEEIHELLKTQFPTEEFLKLSDELRGRIHDFLY